MKSLPALLGAVLLALGLVACGEGGKSSTATTSASQAAGAASSSAPTSTAPTKTSSSAASSARSANGQATQSAGASSTARRYPHGDNSIQTFGHRGGEAERQTVDSIVKRYYAAVAAGDGSTACSLMARGLANSIAKGLGRSPALRGKGCGGILSLLFKRRSGSATVDTSVQVTQLRVNGNRAFALLRSKTMPQGEITVYREGGAWKIGALIGSALPQ